MVSDTVPDASMHGLIAVTQVGCLHGDEIKASELGTCLLRYGAYM